MLIYITVIVAVAAVLYLSFRALSGTPPVAADDYRSALRRIAGFVAARTAQLEQLRADDMSSNVGATTPANESVDSAGDAAASLRKALSGYQQTLTTLQAQAVDGVGETLETARSLLSAAIEDYGWVCRMIESGNRRDNLGVQRAIDALMSHGAQCLDSAAAMLAETALPA